MANTPQSTQQLIVTRNFASGSLIQSLISDLWESMDFEMEAMKGINKLTRVAKYLARC